MNSPETIVMADVIGSRDRSSPDLHREMNRLLKHLNKDQARLVLSPLVTTLGDEFQGLTFTTSAAFELLFAAESFIRQKLPALKLRYVIHEGQIETEINREQAYEMLGPGLTAARKMLTEGGTQRPRFQVHLTDPLRTRRLRQLLTLLENLLGEWKDTDFPLIQAMIENPNDVEVGRQFERNRSSIYRRRETLRIEDFLILRSFILDLAFQPWSGPEVQRLRKRKGFSQRALAKKAGLSQNKLSALEKSEAQIPDEYQASLTAAFDLAFPGQNLELSK